MFIPFTAFATPHTVLILFSFRQHSVQTLLVFAYSLAIALLAGFIIKDTILNKK
jgi:hypothetical protein